MTPSNKQNSTIPISHLATPRQNLYARPYEERLADDPRWALSEGSKHFEGTSGVQDTLQRIAKRLDELGIPYAIVGAMAMFGHGYRRFTEDVDILVSHEGLRRVHKELDGLGYVPPFTGSKNLSDAKTGVRIEFLVSGQFPGDGKPKPVAFPEPAAQAIRIDDVSYLNLPRLVEIKLASGMTSSERIKDLADVQELIKVLNLPADFSNQLDPYVRNKYTELWQATRQRTRRYIRIWRNKFLTVDAKSLEEVAAILREAAGELEAMRKDGVTLDPDGGTADDYAYLVTSDPQVAKKYDMHDEAEFLGEDGPEKDQDTPDRR